MEKNVRREEERINVASVADHSPILVVARSEQWVFGSLHAGIADSIPSGGMSVFLL
jgi:hypothetical protein